MHIPAHSPKWANRPPRGPKEAPKLLFKNTENARTIRPKRSQASGWHAKRPDMQFHLCFTGQTGPWAQNTPVFTATFGGSQGAPGRAPRGLQEASLQPCPQEAPKRPRVHQEAPSLTSVSQACHDSPTPPATTLLHWRPLRHSTLRALSTLGQPRRDTRNVNN